MRVNEIFYSLQGEGLYAGAPAVFVRLQGCRLKCKFCDTPKAIDPKGGQEMPVSLVAHTACNLTYHNRRVHLVITGGEPLQQFTEVTELLEQTAPEFIRQEIETAQISDWQLQQLLKLRHLLITISPKATRVLSQVAKAMCTSNATYRDKLVLKVLGFEQLPDKADSVFDRLVSGGAQEPQDGHLFIQPIWTPEWRAGDKAMQDAVHWSEWCKNHPRWRLSMQLHKLLGVA